MKRRHDFWRRIDIQIRRYCRMLTQKQQVILVITAFTVFASCCLYMLFSSLLNFGHPDKGLEIEHIRSLDEMLNEDTEKKDNHFKDYYDYGYPENQDTARFVA